MNVEQDIKQKSFKEKVKDLNIKQKIKSFFYEIFSFPMYLITHPIGGWDDFKREKKGKFWVAIFYLVAMIMALIISQTCSGFLVNQSNPKDFDLLLTVSLVIFPVIIGTAANWCMTTLFDGKGNSKEIFMVICYSFFPYVWLSLIGTIVSNFIIQDEVVYVTVLNSLGVIFTCYMMFFGLMVIHEFGMMRNILMIIFTIVAIAVILFIALLFLTLIQQMTGWVSAIINELKMRYF